MEIFGKLKYDAKGQLKQVFRFFEFSPINFDILDVNNNLYIRKTYINFSSLP